jgi:hypothetical protein
MIGCVFAEPSYSPPGFVIPENPLGTIGVLIPAVIAFLIVVAQKKGILILK